ASGPEANEREQREPAVGGRPAGRDPERRREAGHEPAGAVELARDAVADEDRRAPDGGAEQKVVEGGDLVALLRRQGALGRPEARRRASGPTAARAGGAGGGAGAGAAASDGGSRDGSSPGGAGTGRGSL